MRGGQVVVVPDVLVLSRTLLESILAEAELTHDRFLELLSEEPTRHHRTLGE
jgi:hypothetical protein